MTRRRVHADDDLARSAAKDMTFRSIHRNSHDVYRRDGYGISASMRFPIPISLLELQDDRPPCRRYAHSNLDRRTKGIDA
jgi:hypothetical protein